MSVLNLVFGGLLATMVGFLPGLSSQDSLPPRVDAISADYSKPDSPGCALGVIRDGRMVYARGYGMANIELNVPISSARFSIWVRPRSTSLFVVQAGRTRNLRFARQ
jgi:CubicO group peptidase (beta-lactamase class C family)